MNKEKSIKVLQSIGTSLVIKRETLYKELSNYFNNSDFYSFTELSNNLDAILEKISIIENKIGLLNSLNEQIQKQILTQNSSEESNLETTK